MRLALWHVLRRLSPRVVIAAAVLVACTVTGVSIAGSSETEEIERDEKLIAWAERGAAVQRERDEARRRHRATPEARAEREESRTRFRDLDAGEALEVASTRHEGVVEAPAFRALRLAPGERLVRFVGDHTAQVELEGRPGGALVESTLPMRARADDGAVRPLDLRLADRGAWLSPQVSLTPVRIPEQADRDVRLEGSGVGFRPAGAAPSEARVVANKAFYAEIEPDTDYLVQPLPTGVESFYQLRSPASPQQLTVDLDLPEGARARRVPGSFPSIEVVRGDEVLGSFQPPVAWDADREPVNVEYAVAGSRLILTVPHASRDVAYPILVDPTWTEDQRFWYTATPPPEHPGSTAGLKDHAGWVYREYDTNDGYHMTEVWGEPSGGFILQADPDANWGRFNEMNYDAPPETHIYRFESLTKHWAYGSTIEIGLWSNSSTGWDPTHVYDQNAFHWGVYRPLSYSTSYYESALYVTECAGNNPCWPYNSNGTPAGTRGNKAVILLRRDNGVTNHPTVWFGGGQVSLLDDTAPNLVSLSENAPDGWVENATFTASATATDAGFGVAQFELWRRAPSSTKLQEKPLGVDVWPGTSSQWSGQCEYTRRPVHCRANDQKTFSHSTGSDPNGVVTYGVRAQDMVSNWSGYSEFTVKLDRSAPRFDVYTGSLWDRRNRTDDHRNEGLYDATHSLHVEAVDDHSGTKSIEVFVDGQSERNRGGYVSSDCSSGGGCRRTLDWTLNADNYSDGEHTISVVARDQLADPNGSTANAHTAIREFQVTVDRRGDIYVADEYDGDPAGGAQKLTDEWARLGTKVSRTADSEILASKSPEPCDAGDPNGAACLVARSRSRESETSPTAADTYLVYRGADSDDDRVPPVGDLLEASFYPEDLQPVETGPLVNALQPWQRRPPGSGITYEVFQFDQQEERGDHPDGTDGETDAPDQVTVRRKLWVDATTHMPIKSEVRTTAGELYGTVYFLYEANRLETSQVPSDFFRIGRPQNVSQEKTVDFRGNSSVDEQTDQETGARFSGYYLGSSFVLGGSQYCLATSFLMNLIEPGPDSISSPDPALEDSGPDPRGAETTVNAAYDVVPTGGSCVPGAGLLDTPPIEIHTAAKSSSTAAAWRRAYRDVGLAIQSDPTHEDRLTAGVQPVLFQLTPTDAYLVRLDNVRHGVLFETATETIIITGPFDRLTVDAVVGEVEVR